MALVRRLRERSAWNQRGSRALSRGDSTDGGAQCLERRVRTEPPAHSDADVVEDGIPSPFAGEAQEPSAQVERLARGRELDRERLPVVKVRFGEVPRTGCVRRESGEDCIEDGNAAGVANLSRNAGLDGAEANG